MSNAKEARQQSKGRWEEVEWQDKGGMNFFFNRWIQSNGWKKKSSTTIFVVLHHMNLFLLNNTFLVLPPSIQPQNKVQVFIWQR